ncbi:MAG: ATP-binding protein [Rhizobiales bacterium 65-79]|mgnify:FL=1|nr:adenine nucleotide alpha hydrolase [Hyphomicrobiales bacterium]OJU04370.1 MAG: ATP-binding protein [Rhizobiales bacterium 65-79]
MPERPKAFLSWSSGKDAAFALLEARRLGLADIVGVLTAINEAADRVQMHGVRHALLDRQIDALGLPAIKVMLPSPCPNAIYEARMEEAFGGLGAEDVRHIVYGDLFLEDIRAYRLKQMERAGMQAIFPLWGRDTGELAREMIASGLEARVACIDTKKLDPSFAGRAFDVSFLRDLPAGIDPCGENGEFHTVVTAGPIFAAPIATSVGEIVERDSFAYADVIPQ